VVDESEYHVKAERTTFEADQPHTEFVIESTS
jgi:hypothetical protein